MLELLTPFLGGLLGAVPNLVTSWVETRNAIRVEHVRAHLNEITEERRVQAAIRLHEAELESQVAAGYPLGVPGRLRSLLPQSGLPTIIVSPPPHPMPGLVELISELLHGVEGFARYATMPSGVFARDGGVQRFIDGEVGARLVARSEFERRPVVIIYFEQSDRSLTAHAYLSSIFGTTGGESGFPFMIAKYGKGSGFARRDTDLPSWHLINLAAVNDREPVEVVAATVSWFVLAVLDTYWDMSAAVKPDLLARTSAGQMIGAHLPPAEHEPADEQFERVEREARQLAGLGYEVTAEKLGEGNIGLHVRGDQDIIFVIDSSYPVLPPTVIRSGDTDVHIDATDWSSECGLADIVEALQ
ncbi:hypothetical protein [Lentzea nigeriaca]|uniref:hypothetical protein n=1 Tax=Lentzea nigeriaca TaxID=1128665 RepID=UPI00195A5E43|nr:hypothetical protein [Lentzea nigeriaca]MBM7863652.1 hypothetical protein [Lentzea nigeriaca]